VFALVHRNVVRTGRGIAVAALLGLLLVGVQIEAKSHALGHFGEWLQQPHDATLQLPADQDACPLCALFAGGADAVSADVPIAAHSAADHPVLRERMASRASTATPSPYRSRAPPSIL
jgi:hypothetical protein